VIESRRHCGFTLLECLIALLVIGLVMGGSLFQVSRYADERAALGERFASHTVAWNRLMEQYQLVQGWVQPNQGLAEADGVAKEFDQSWRWQMDVTSTLAKNFYRYEVRVFPDGDNGEQNEELAALLVAYFIAE
jgi:prepilin-type N-terminal cleavage/methylation domain-containing protein